MMIITKLELKNIKSYKESEEIGFSQGINAICGPNGAGKSTILEAIGFALFDARAHKTDNFIREGERKGEITVSFIDSMDDREYQAIRPVGSGTPYIFDPEIKRKIVTGKEDYFAWLKEHMDVSTTADLRALFDDAVGVPQGNLTAVFSESTGVRKTKFDPLLQVEDYESVWKQLRSSINQLESQSHAQETEIASLSAKLERLPTIQKDEKGLIRVIEKDEDEQEKVANELKQATEKKSSLDRLEKIIQNLKNQIDTFKSKISGLDSRLEDAKKSVEEAVKAKDIVEEVKDGHKAYGRAQMSLKELEKQRSNREKLKEKLSKTAKAIALYQQSIKNFEKQLIEISEAESFVTQLKPKSDQQAELESQLKDLEKSRSNLENAQYRIIDEKARLANLLEEKEVLIGKLKLLDEIEKELKKLDEEHQKLTGKEASIKAYFIQANTRREQLQERIAILKQTEEAQCPVCQQELDDVHVHDLEHKYQQELKDIEIEDNIKRDEQSGMKSELKQMRDQNIKLEKERKSLPSRSRVSEIEGDIKKQEEVLSEWEARRTKLVIIPEQIADIKKKLESLGDPKREYVIHKAKAAERARVENKLEVETSNLETAKEEHKSIEEQLKPFAELDTDITFQQRELETHQEDHQVYLQNIQTAEKLAEREKKVGEVEIAIKYDTETLHNLVNEFEISNKYYDEDEHKRTKKDFQELSSKNAALTERISINKENLKKIQKEIAELLPLTEDLETAKEEYKLLQQLRDTLIFIRTVIRDAGPHITKQLVRIISNEADKIYGDILNDYTTRLNWSEEYEITFEQQGNNREFSQLSGGEKMAAALAVRLALLRYMSGISLAFFDEPTAHLDLERRTNLSDQITQIKGFNQLFVISHDDTFERNIHHVIRISKESGVSQVEVGLHATVK